MEEEGGGVGLCGSIPGGHPIEKDPTVGDPFITMSREESDTRKVSILDDKGRNEETKERIVLGRKGKRRGGGVSFER